MMFGDIHVHDKHENNPLQAIKTSFLQSRHNGFSVKGSTDDFCQK